MSCLPDRTLPGRKDITCLSSRACLRSTGREDRSLDRNVGMVAVSIQGLYAGIGSHHRWNRSGCGRSMSIQAFDAGCIHAGTRMRRLSCIGHGANAYTRD